MQQSVSVKFPNKKQEYSAINLVAVYILDGKLCTLSELELNKKKLPAPTELKSKPAFVAIEGDKYLSVAEDFILVPEANTNIKLAKVREKLEKATLVYGKDIRLQKNQYIVSVRNYDFFKQLFIQNMFATGASFAGFAALSAIGFFTLQKWGKDLGQSITNAFGMSERR